jgi:hypothetical protein
MDIIRNIIMYSRHLFGTRVRRPIGVEDSLQITTPTTTMFVSEPL